MNPFDLSGPEFLLFYVVFSALVIIGIVSVRRQTEAEQTPRIDLSDPLLIAFLRGGHSEVMRVAAVSLIDRGLLLCIGTRLQTAPHARAEAVRRPVDIALLEKFVRSDEAQSMFDDARLIATCQQYEQTLKQVRLLPDETVTQLRRLIFACAVLLLGGVGLVKLIFAFSRGRMNVGFLIVLMIAAIFLAAKQSFPRLTESGKAMLEGVKHLYSGLRARASSLQPGGATVEPMMLAAVFGVGALGGDGFAYTRTLFPRANQSATTSSCGSSCSSGGGSCGGGCGGGGCGGCGG